ncbi:MAG: aminomethyl-transferring glycine dehydrogenase subunit GcvPA [Planctomycetota bacterium]|nr:aminomethyl-transferring glycine dehydrogenase subunit GcvPA [Planctomycetota bacterium]
MDYVPHNEKDIKEMLRIIGVETIDSLFRSIPSSVRFRGEMALPEPLSEIELKKYLSSLAGRNLDVSKDYACFLGGGAYFHFIPALVDQLSARSEFYTAYTPYQAEASQGTLQTIFEYQSCICELTGMDVSNASHYDGATALAEAAVMTYHIHNRKRSRFILSATIHPEYRRVVKTYLKMLGVEIIEVDYDKRAGTTDLDQLKRVLDEKTASVAFQSPNFFGCIEDAEEISRLTHSVGAKLISCVEPLSLGLLKPPGEYDSDIAVGDGQGLGNYLSFGGPAFGFFATKNELVRRMPGRIVGQTLDSDGKVAYVLTLQTREQHIRREKATSNICTNQALCAMRGLIYLVTLGRNGFVKLANLCLQKAHYAAERLKQKGLQLRFSAPFFKEFALRLESPETTQKNLFEEKRILIGPLLSRWYEELADSILISFTEMNTAEEISALLASL